MDNRENNQSLGDYIRTRRTAMGLSLANAAEASDLDDSYWSRLENDLYKTPSPRHLQTIAVVLEVPVEDLYGLAGYEIPKRLPSFQPYLRAKYDLPPEAIAEIERYFDMLRNYYGILKDQPVFPPKPKPESAIEETEGDKEAA